MVEHNWRFVQYDDPAMLEIRFIVKCNRCGTFVQARVTYQYLANKRREDLQKMIEKRILKEAMNGPIDCDEARVVNLIREIHES